MADNMEVTDSAIQHKKLVIEKERDCRRASNCYSKFYQCEYHLILNLQIFANCYLKIEVLQKYLEI